MQTHHDRRRGPARASASALRRSSLSFVACALGLLGTACQGPGGATPAYYGDGQLCTSTGVDERGPISLLGTIQPLQEVFDVDVERPRVIALLPHAGCENGARVLREQVLDAFPYADLRLYVVWQDVGRRNDRRAAARASQLLGDPRVTCFHDASGLAGHAFARGRFPVAEAREVFLFYPAGVAWPQDRATAWSRPVGVDIQQAPEADEWVHQLGRVAPERFCAPRELPGAMRRAVKQLIERAAERERRGA